MTGKPIRVVGLSGDPETRGNAFGELRRVEIQACVDDWLGSLRAAGIDDPPSYVSAMLRATDFLPAIREHTPELLEEIRGIAHGSNQPFDLVLGMQLMDEEWAYRPIGLGRGEASQKCSSVAVRSRAGITWVGQNMDLGGYTDGHQVLLQIAPGSAEPKAFVFTIGPMIGLMGVNAKGVGVCVNSLPQLPSARKGLPVSFLIRKLLTAPSAAAAERIVREVPHASAQHYLIADAGEIHSVEASPLGVSEYRSPDPTRVMHTNHPLAIAEARPIPKKEQANSVTRLQSLTSRLMRGEPDLESIKGALSARDDPDYPVCRVPSAQARVSTLTGMIGFTTGSMISALCKEAASVDSWVSAGPPCLRPYTQVSLSG